MSISRCFEPVATGFYRSSSVRFLLVFLSQKVELQPVQFSLFWFGPVRFRFISGSLNRTFKHQWLDFIPTPFLFSLVVLLLFLPAFHESPATPLMSLALDVGSPPPLFFCLHIPHTCLRSGIKVRLIIILCFNFLIVPHGLGFIRAEGYFFLHIYIVHRS